MSLVDWELNEQYERTHCEKCERLRKHDLNARCKNHKKIKMVKSGKKIDASFILRLLKKREKESTNQS